MAQAKEVNITHHHTRTLLSSLRINGRCVCAIVDTFKRMVFLGENNTVYAWSHEQINISFHLYNIFGDDIDWNGSWLNGMKYAKRNGIGIFSRWEAKCIEFRKWFQLYGKARYQEIQCLIAKSFSAIRFHRLFFMIFREKSHFFSGENFHFLQFLRGIHSFIGTLNSSYFDEPLSNG